MKTTRNVLFTFSWCLFFVSFNGNHQGLYENPFPGEAFLRVQVEASEWWEEADLSGSDSSRDELNVLLFEECKFLGRNASLSPGRYNDNELGIGNDRLSSIIVPINLRVILFEDNNFQGQSTTITGNEACLSAYWNDRVSSLIIESKSGGGYTYNNYGGSQDGVTLFSDCGYRGRTNTLGPGRYGDDELGIGNDELSAIRVPNGLRVILYEDNNFKGESTTITRDERCLSNYWNDRVSSLVVETTGPGYAGNQYGNTDEGITLYKECDFRGSSRTLSPGRYVDYELGVGNDELSSLRIPPGYRVILYEDNNYKGESTTITRDTRCLPNNWNDRVSSLVVETTGYGYSNDDYRRQEEGITLFKDCDYRGNSRTLGPGRYVDYELGVGNDEVSSIRIPRGYRVILYEDNNFRGESTVINSDTRCLPNNWNDRISSIVVETAGSMYSDNQKAPIQGVTLYEHCDYRGDSRTLGPGRYEDNELGVGNDALSSIRIPEGLRVILYEDDDFKGQSLMLRKGVSCLPREWNDRVSSIEVQSMGKKY